MRHRSFDWPERERVEEIAKFGEAHLVKHLDGRLELRGGTEQDRAEAHAWMKQFNLQSAPLTVRRVG